MIGLVGGEGEGFFGGGDGLGEEAGLGLSGGECLEENGVVGLSDAGGVFSEGDGARTIAQRSIGAGSKNPSEGGERAEVIWLKF